jgi:hypothetical protein
MMGPVTVNRTLDSIEVDASNVKPPIIVSVCAVAPVPNVAVTPNNVKLIGMAGAKPGYAGVTAAIMPAASERMDDLLEGLRITARRPELP